MSVAVRMRDAAVRVGGRTLWSGVDVDLAAGQLLAVLGPNGAGKTSLIRVLLGQLALAAGTAEVAGAPPGHSRAVGYVPQLRSVATGGVVRGREFVAFGLDGHRFGPQLSGRHERRAKVDEALAAVDATALAHRPIDALSGGELQRLRIAQALAGDPTVLLCDEPLLSLDVARQAEVASVLDRRRREHGTAIVFVTHDINPVLGLVDEVLYLANGQARLGPPDRVLTSASLTEIYGTPINVVRIGDAVHVLGAGGSADGAHCHEITS
jgi:zinc/manganese transport system ATP-binding protein